MFTVSKEEAQNSLNRLLAWAKSYKQPSEGTLGDWIFTRGIVKYEPIPELSEITMVITVNATQRHWRTPSDFPACHSEYVDNPLATYAENLKPGLPFCHNHIYSAVISKSTLSKDSNLSSSYHWGKRN